jgi:hypothetical protein
MIKAGAFGRPFCFHEWYGRRGHAGTLAAV